MHDLTDDQFYKALSDEDDLGMVVRAHIHIEHWVEKFISASMPFYDEYKKQLKADYDTKVLLSCAMGLSPDLKRPLQAVGTLRNSFAHKPNFNLSKADVRNIYSTLSSKHKEQVQIGYKELALKCDRVEKKYSELSFKLKLDLLLMFLRKKLINAYEQLGDVRRV